jgi:hypothetical protein
MRGVATSNLVSGQVGRARHSVRAAFDEDWAARRGLRALPLHLM